VWVTQKSSFHFSESYEESIKQLVEEIFKPLKTRSSLLKAQRKMPNAAEFSEESLKELEVTGYVFRIPSIYEDKITITPEGLAFLASRETGLALDNFNKVIFDLYRKHCYHQIRRLVKKETLKPKHIAILLFFLLNGSIGYDKAYVLGVNKEDRDCIERVVVAYLESRTNILTVHENYSLDYYLVEAKRILGDVIYNDKPRYFLKREELSLILKAVQQATNHDSQFPTRWASLREEYRKNLTYLRSRNNSHYSASWALELDNLLLKTNNLAKDLGE